MRIKDIIRVTQPEVYKKLCKENMKEKLSFDECKDLMRHSSYIRHKGAIRQVR